MSNNTQLSKLSSQLSSKLNLGTDGSDLIETLKATAFKEPATDAQMAALLIVSNQYNLNPWTKEIYAFPDKKNGIIPVVGVDGWSRIINSHPQYDGMDFEVSETMVQMPEAKSKAPEWVECRIYRKDRTHPTVIREYLDECYREPFKKQGSDWVNLGPWQTHPKRFLRHKAMIQCSRVAFGFVGIYDQDEAERIAEGVVANTAANATKGDHNNPERDTLIEEARTVAEKGNIDALRSHFQSLTKEQRKILGAQEMAFWGEHCTKVGETIIDAEIVEESNHATTD